jgi:hypothetical protein
MHKAEIETGARVCEITDEVVLTAVRRTRADLLQQVALTKETIGQSEELLRRADVLLAKSPLAP